jgi:predicted dehydrogenase
MLNIAFVGAGRVAELHQQILSTMPNMNLKGLYDVDATRGQQRSVQWGVKAYASFDDLLGDEQVDAVYILTQAETHVELSLRCLEAKKAVFVEKPVSHSPEDIDRLVVASKTSGQVVMPGHNYVYMPEFKRIVRLVRNGDLGTIRSVWINYAIKHPEEIAAAYGGILEEVMVHHTYMTLALLGKPERLYAGVAEPAWEKHTGEDQAWMTWEYSKGLSAHLFASFAVGDESADPWTFVVKVLGTQGSASLTWRSSIFNRALGTLSFALPVYEESYEHEALMFQSAVLDGAPLISTLEDAAASARIIHAAYRAARQRCAVSQMVDGYAQW